LSVVQLIPGLTGFLVVTIPSEVSTLAVRRSISFAKTVNVRILGVIENMSYFVCPTDSSKHFIFGQGKGKAMAEEMGVPLLGQIPIESKIAESNDLGEPFFLKYPNSDAAREFTRVAESIAKIIESA